LSGMETLLQVMEVLLVAVHGELTVTAPQLVGLKVTEGFVPNPPPVMVTGIVVPAVHTAGVTGVAMLTGCTRVRATGRAHMPELLVMHARIVAGGAAVPSGPKAEFGRIGAV